MMVKKKQLAVGSSTIYCSVHHGHLGYCSVHHGHLGLKKADMLYPRKKKAIKKQASPNFKPTGKSIE